MADAVSTFTIDLCVGWAKIGEAVAGTFDGVIRDLAVGEWRLSGMVDAVDLQGSYSLADVDTVRVVRDATIVFAGQVAPVAAGGAGGLELVDAADGRRFTLSGPDLWSVLASRVAYPTPSTGPPWADSHDVRTGLASTCAAGYVLANAGVLATADRLIPGLTVVDMLAGATGTWSARLQPLDQQVARVCRDGGITCRLAIGFAGALTVTLCSPVDRSSSVIFSDQGDLTSLQQVTTPESATFVIAGGQGQLTGRTFATAGTATGAARRERFSDQSALSTATEVARSATSTLAAAAETLAVQASVTDSAALGAQYLQAYDIGDTVAVEIDDVRYPVTVQAVTVHVSPERAVIRPSLGPGVRNLVSGLLRDVAGLQSRLDSTIA